MKIAVVILSRNMPEQARDAVQQFKDLDVDIFVVENGSDESNYCTHSNILVKETNGVAWGVNHSIQSCYDLGYDLIWFSYNDARIDAPGDFLKWATKQFKSDTTVGLCAVRWGSMWNTSGLKNPHNWKKGQTHAVSFFDELSFIVSREAVETISTFDARLTPFFDSSNFTNHYAMLAPAVALYASGMKMVVDSEYTAWENAAPNDENSKEARGFEDAVWKHEVGPQQAVNWLDRFFSELSSYNPGDPSSRKQKRDCVVREICKHYGKN